MRRVMAGIWICAIACGGEGAPALDGPMPDGPVTDATEAEIDAAVDAGTDAVPIDAAEIDAAEIDAAEIDATAVDAPVIDAPAIDAPAIDAPAIDAPAIDAPAIDAPVIDAPVIDAPVIDAAAIDAPASDAPAIDAPVDAPLLGAPCVANPVDVTRITGANIQPDDNGFYGWTHAQGFYAADVDGDADQDLMVFELLSTSAGTQTNRIRVFPREGAGFGAVRVSSFTVPATSNDFNRITDIDGDGDLDVVLVDVVTAYPVLQSAAGGFTLQASRDLSLCNFSSDERLKAFTILDTDRDGRDDMLATVSYGGLGSPPAGMSRILGGSGGFVSGTCVAPSMPATGFPPALAAVYGARGADFDDDGHDDLVTFGVPGAAMTLYRSTAPSTFVAGADTVPTPSGNFIWIDQVPGQPARGILAISSTGTSTTIARHAATATGLAPAEQVVTVPQGGQFGVPRGLAVGDFNGDQRIDVLVVGYQAGVTTPSFSIACNRGDVWEVAQGILPDVFHLRAYDFDGDGRSELAAKVGSEIRIWRLQ